jgi:hypothetical protein
MKKNPGFSVHQDEPRERDGRRFKLVRLGRITPSRERQYTVKNVIPRAGIVVVWGPPKCGKSFWTLDLLLHIALNRQYRGRRTKGGPAVYLALEGHAGFDARVEAFRQANDWAKDGPFYLVKARLNLVKDHVALIREIRDQAGKDQPTIVAIDTLNRSLVGSESKDEDMSAYLAAAEFIRDAFDCTVIIVHHCGVDGSRPRGHTSLTGAVDAQLAVTRDEQKNVIVQVEYMKDGEEGAVIASRLEHVDVGIDQDGDPISTCIITPLDEASIPKPAKKGAKPKSMTRTGKIAFQALREALTQAGTINGPGSEHIPAGARTTTKDMWRRYAYQAGISDSEDQSAKRKAFARGYDAVLGDGHAKVWGEQVWIPSAKEKAA